MLNNIIAYSFIIFFATSNIYLKGNKLAKRYKE